MGRVADRRGGARWCGRATVLVITTLLALAALLFAAGVASAAIWDPDTEPCWEFYVAGPGGGNDTAVDVAKTATATWVVGQSQGLVTNLDASLFRVPTASYAQPVLHLWDSSAHNNDANYAVAARGSYVYSAGATRNAKNNLDLIVIRWASTTGDFKWVRRYAGPAGKDDVATDVAIDGNGNVIVCGTGQNSVEWDYWVVRKYSPAGDLKWTFTYDGSAFNADRPAEMVVDSKNNIYVTGMTRQVSVDGACTIKLSPAGARLWTRKYRGPDGLGGAATAITRCPSGGVYIGGATTTAADGVDAFIRRYAADGTTTAYELWTGDILAGDDPQTLSDIAVASNGRIIGVGQDDGKDSMWVSWKATGDVYFGNDDTTAGTDSWTAVGTDAYGGVYLTGPYDNDSVNPNIRTWRFSVLEMGGEWMYDYDVNGYNREVKALAVNGLSCAVVGRQYNGSDYDQYLHIWTY